MTPPKLFPDLPNEARLWIHIADRTLTTDEQRALTEHIKAFLANWTSHGHPVTGAVEIIDDRLLLLAATIDGDASISGCGIDAATHAIEEAAQALGIDWASPLHVIYRDSDGHLQVCSRSDFRERIESEGLTTETRMLDPSITTVGALREGALEAPAGASWHGRVFDLPQPA